MSDVYPFYLPDKDLRAAARALRAECRSFPDELMPVPKSKWGPSAKSMASTVFEMWRSRFFLVQMHQTGNDHIVRMSVNRCEVDVTNRRWRDGVSWDELQDLKAQVGRGDLDAVEVFPRDQDVVNVANVRHLFIFSEPLPYAWRKKK